RPARSRAPNLPYVQVRAGGLPCSRTARQAFLIVAGASVDHVAGDAPVHWLPLYQCGGLAHRGELTLVNKGQAPTKGKSTTLFRDSPNRLAAFEEVADAADVAGGGRYLLVFLGEPGRRVTVPPGEAPPDVRREPDELGFADDGAPRGGRLRVVDGPALDAHPVGEHERVRQRVEYDGATRLGRLEPARGDDQRDLVGEHAGPRRDRGADLGEALGQPDLGHLDQLDHHRRAEHGRDQADGGPAGERAQSRH